jgi:hypothetical protein
MRDFHLVVPRDCVASVTEEENAAALDQMAKILKADTRPSTEIDLGRPLHRRPRHEATASSRAQGDDPFKPAR